MYCSIFFRFNRCAGIRPGGPRAVRLQIYEKIPGFETKPAGFLSKLFGRLFSGIFRLTGPPTRCPDPSVRSPACSAPSGKTFAGSRLKKPAAPLCRTEQGVASGKATPCRHIDISQITAPSHFPPGCTYRAGRCKRKSSPDCTSSRNHAPKGARGTPRNSASRSPSGRTCCATSPPCSHGVPSAEHGCSWSSSRSP